MHSQKKSHKRVKKQEEKEQLQIKCFLSHWLKHFIAWNHHVTNIIFRVSFPIIQYVYDDVPIKAGRQ